MKKTGSDPSLQDAVEWALMHGLAVNRSLGAASHCPFSFAPTLIEQNRFEQQQPSQWVLKNQGEGGGHCIFDDHILPKLQGMKQEERRAWALMRRLHPRHRDRPVLLVREGRAQIADDLVSEIGLFTLHVNGRPVASEDGYAGYLVRSKPASVSESRVLRGKGVLDSLAFAGQP